MRPSPFDKLRMRSLGLPEKTHLMLSPSKYDCEYRTVNTWAYLSFVKRRKTEHART